MTDYDLVTVGRFENRVHADLVRLRLESMGVPAVLIHDTLPHLGFGPLFSVEVQVHREDIDRAVEILNTDQDEPNP